MMGCGGFGKREGRQAALESTRSEHTNGRQVPAVCPSQSQHHYLPGLKVPWLLTQKTRGSTNSVLNSSTGTKVTLCCRQKNDLWLCSGQLRTGGTVGREGWSHSLDPWGPLSLDSITPAFSLEPRAVG